MDSQLYNNNMFTQNVGFRYTGENSACLQNMFSQESIDSISKEITSRLRGLREDGRDIVVTDDVITSVLSNIQDTYRVNTGDIFTRYNMVRTPVSDYSYMVAQTIDVIVNDISDEYQIIKNNMNLTVWTSVLGTENNHRLRSHDIIKIRKRRPAPMQFNLNY